MSESYDAVVIGSGPAGEVAASRLPKLGLRTALVERELVGGECAYWACIPSKTLLRPPEARFEARHAAGLSEPEQRWSEIVKYRNYMTRNLDDSGAVKGYREATQLSEVPASVVVLGGGPVGEGVELCLGRQAKAARREHGKRILELDDATEVGGEQLLIATGPRPADVGLQRLGRTNAEQSRSRWSRGFHAPDPRAPG